MAPRAAHPHTPPDQELLKITYFVARRLHRRSRPFLAYDECLSAALLGVAQALHTYDHTRGTKPFTWLCTGGFWYAYREVQKQLRHHRDHPMTPFSTLIASKQAHGNDCNHPALTAPDRKKPPQTTSRILHDAPLPPRTKAILSLRFDSNLTLKAIGEQFHLSRERVRQIINQACSILKDHLQNHVNPRQN
jgi:RNA polymerase sigma factor (sigma-70 family)